MSLPQYFTPATSQTRSMDPCLSKSLFANHLSNAYAESWLRQASSPVSAASLRLSSEFSSIEECQTWDGGDLVDSILSQRTRLTAPTSSYGGHEITMSVSAPHHRATGTRDVLGMNLIRGIRSTLAPVPFSVSKATSLLQTGTRESALLEGFLLDCENDPRTMDCSIDLDALCATFASDAEEITPSDSNHSISLATECQGRDLIGISCEICGRRGDNHVQCSGSCSSPKAICRTCLRQDSTSKCSPGSLHGCKNAWLCGVCCSSEARKNPEENERLNQTGRSHGRKRRSQEQESTQDQAQSFKLRRSTFI